MPNWTFVDATTDVTPDVARPKNARFLHLFRQTLEEHDRQGNVSAGVVREDELVGVAPDVIKLRNQLRVGVKNAIDRSRRCLVTLTGGTEILNQIDTLVSKINKDKKVTKTDLYPILYQYDFSKMNAGKKPDIMRRFFGAGADDIMIGINSTYDPQKKEFKTSITAPYIFRTVLGITCIGLNLQAQGVVLADLIAATGDSVTNWGKLTDRYRCEWKAAISRPGLIGYDASGIFEALTRGMATMDTGHLRGDIYRLENADDPMMENFPDGVFRNGDMFTLTYLHEATHLFAATSDSYYFDEPWQDKGISDGVDNPGFELDGGRPITARALVNADSYAWLIYLFGDSRFS